MKHYAKHRYHNTPGAKEKLKSYTYLPINRFKIAHRRASNRGLVFTISFNDYITIIEKGCFYCKADLLKNTGISLDRIDNCGGYTIDNVLPCCATCNSLRQDLFTVEETKVMVQALLKFRGAA